MNINNLYIFAIYAGHDDWLIKCVRNYPNPCIIPNVGDEVEIRQNDLMCGLSKVTDRQIDLDLKCCTLFCPVSRDSFEKLQKIEIW